MVHRSVWWIANREIGIKIASRAKICLEVYAPSTPLALSAMMSTLAERPVGRWDGEEEDRSTGHRIMPKLRKWCREHFTLVTVIYFLALNMALVCSWHGPGMVLTCSWYGLTIALAWSIAWHGPEHGPGLLLTWSWYGPDMALNMAIAWL